MILRDVGHVTREPNQASITTSVAVLEPPS
jgi:hypothetical protein